MSSTSLVSPLHKHLRKLHARAQTIEEEVRGLVSKTQTTGGDAAHLEAQFADFSVSLIAFFQTIRQMASSSQEIDEMLGTSVSNQLSNAIMVAENLDILAQVDYVLFANQLILVQNKQVIVDGIRELVKRGPEGKERVKWLEEALKQNGA